MTSNAWTLTIVITSVIIISSICFGYKRYAEEANTQNERSSNSSKINSKINNKSVRKKVVKKEIESDASDDEKDRDIIRGYKKTSDGKTTSYFNREISSEEKKLLGDSSPKLLANSNLSCEPRLISVSTSPVGSEWNKGGTWEEKNYTQYSHAKIQELLLAAEFVDSKDNVKVSITSIESIDGDSSITMIRGKTKYIYDITVKASWRLEYSSSNSLVGIIEITDINGECDYEYKIIESSSNKNKVNEAKLINKYIKSSSVGLQNICKRKLDLFLKEFKNISK